MAPELHGSWRDPPLGYGAGRPIDPDAEAQVTLYLRRRCPEGTLGRTPPFSRSDPTQRQYVVRSAFAAEFGAWEDDVSIVRRVAGHSGLDVGEEDLGRRAIRLVGPAGRLSSLFGVQLHQYDGPQGPFRCRAGTLLVPDGLEGRLVGVFGLDTRPQLRTQFRIPRIAGATYSPLQVATGYDFPPGADGNGQTVAILEFGGGFRQQDLDAFFSALGRPTPRVTAVPVDGSSNNPTGAGSGPDAEVELDIEVAGACAPGANIVVYFAPNSDQGFLDALGTAVHDATRHPSVVSISWGGPEPTWTDQARTVFNQLCEDATAMGVTVIAAAGDNGATDGVASGGLAVDFPASSPYVLGCGGTKLSLDGTRITEEVVWNELADGEGATGGGVSQIYPIPAYQRNAGVPSAHGGFLGRGVPDVAADADPTTGYSVVVNGVRMTIGGTSAVAPLWSALVARLNQAVGAPMGFLHPLLYAPTAAGTFRDITQGNNGGYDAGPGWDACTGLGTPSGVALLAAMVRK